MSSVAIHFESENFPAALGLSHSGSLTVSWDEILHAAITVGRPSWYYVFRHGTASGYEALFRWSILRMAVEQRGTWMHELHRTSAVDNLDPTEKGAVNYFLGMTFCKLFAAKLLNTPWMLHVDVARPRIGFRLAGRSRPDLIGQDDSTKRWHAFECKGRSATPELTTKEKAKDQAQRIVVVDGQPCDLHIGAITYFRNEVLQYYWRDPPPNTEEPIEIPLGADIWRYYYAPALELVRNDRNTYTRMLTEPVMAQLEEADVTVGIHPKVLQALERGAWSTAREIARTEWAFLISQRVNLPPYQADGMAIVAGPSWSLPFEKASP
jgi:hypothetical protein